MSLNSPSQKALATKTVQVVPAVTHDVTKAHTVVSGVQNDVVNTSAIVSDNCRSGSKRPEDTRGQDRMVSTIVFYLLSSNHLSLPRLTQGQRSQLEANLISNLCTQSTWRNIAPPAREHARNRLRNSPGRPYNRFPTREKRYEHSKYDLRNPSYRRGGSRSK